MVGDGFDHVAESEFALFLGHAGVEDDLQQEVAEFVTQIVEIAARYGVGDFIRFLERVGGDGLESLLDVPWAAGNRRPQRGHDLEQAGYVFGRFHRRMLARRRAYGYRWG